MATMTARAQWIDGERFLTTGTSGHAVVLDSNRESDTAPGPMEMVLAALCACTATDMVTILRKKRQPLERLTVSARAERAPEPPQVYTRIELEYRIGGAVERKAAEDALQLSKTKYCSVSIMLGKTAEISSTLVLEAPAAIGAR